MLTFPGRTVVTRRPHRRVGLVSCSWLQLDQIPYESLFERSFIYLALLCPGVQHIKAQPFRVVLDDRVSYTPDFLIEYSSGQQLVVEVKPNEFVGKHRDKLKEASLLLCRHGYEFLLATEDLIECDDGDEPASLVLRHARSHAMTEVIKKAQGVLLQAASPSSIESFMANSKLTFHEVLGLIGRRKLFLAPSLRFDVVYLNDQEGEEHGCPYGPAWFGRSDL